MSRRLRPYSPRQCAHGIHNQRNRGDLHTKRAAQLVVLICLQVVLAATSCRAKPFLDQRGLASSEVLVCGPVLNIHGISLDDHSIDFITVKGREFYDATLPIFVRNSPSVVQLEAIQGDDNIGMLTLDGYLVKFATKDGLYSLLKVI